MSYIVHFATMYCTYNRHVTYFAWIQRLHRTMAMDARADASGSEEEDYSDDQEQMRTGDG